MATKIGDSYNQPTVAPTTKLTAAGISGAITVVLLALVENFTNVEVSSEVASSLTIIVAFLMGYFTKERIS